MMDAWVDFNDVRNGRTTTLRKYVREGIQVDDGIVVGDFEGNRCHGVVRKIVRNKVELELDLSTFHEEEAA